MVYAISGSCQRRNNNLRSSRGVTKLHPSPLLLPRQFMELGGTAGKKLLSGEAGRVIRPTEGASFLRKRAQEISRIWRPAPRLTEASDEIVWQVMFMVSVAEKPTPCDYRPGGWQNAEGLSYSPAHLFSGNVRRCDRTSDMGPFDFGILIEPRHYIKYDYIRLPATDRIWGLLMRSKGQRFSMRGAARH